MAWKGLKPTSFSKNVSDDIQRHARETAALVLRNLVFASPIDTGRFINNWVVGIGNKNNSIFKGKNRTDPLARGGKVIAKHTGFKDIWISNNLPYAVPLNNGHSGQAPANFVESSIERAINE